MKEDFDRILDELIKATPINSSPSFNKGDQAEWYTYRAEWGAKPEEFGYERIGRMVQIKKISGDKYLVRDLCPPYDEYLIEKWYLFPVQN